MANALSETRHMGKPGGHVSSTEEEHCRLEFPTEGVPLMYATTETGFRVTVLGEQIPLGFHSQKLLMNYEWQKINRGRRYQRDLPEGVRTLWRAMAMCVALVGDNFSGVCKFQKTS